MKEFLIQDNVSLSFEIERVKRSHFERLRQHIENSENAELEAVRELGSRLYFDPSGPTSTYGTQVGPDEGQGIMAEGGRSA